MGDWDGEAFVVGVGAVEKGLVERGVHAHVFGPGETGGHGGDCIGIDVLKVCDAIRNEVRWCWLKNGTKRG
jgi:hypothetical protein